MPFCHETHLAYEYMLQQLTAEVVLAVRTWSSKCDAPYQIIRDEGVALETLLIKKELTLGYII